METVVIQRKTLDAIWSDAIGQFKSDAVALGSHPGWFEIKLTRGVLERLEKHRVTKSDTTDDLIQRALGVLTVN